MPVPFEKLPSRAAGDNFSEVAYGALSCFFSRATGVGVERLDKGSCVLPPLKSGDAILFVAGKNFPSTHVASVCVSGFPVAGGER